MIAVPLKETGPKNEFRLKRLPYWLILITLGFLSNTTQSIEFLVMVMIGWFVITYARIKDCGYNGWWTLGCILPLFNVVIGFIKSKPDLTIMQVLEVD